MQKRKEMLMRMLQPRTRNDEEQSKTSEEIDNENLTNSEYREKANRIALQRAQRGNLLRREKMLN